MAGFARAGRILSAIFASGRLNSFFDHPWKYAAPLIQERDETAFQAVLTIQMFW
jgi:hypothetical protein